MYTHNFKFLLSLVCIIIALVLTVSIVFAANTVIWYLPHPDDETLGMADSIHQSVLEGNNNYFIFFTKGSSSLAKLALKGDDGKICQLTPENFGQARVNETLAALQVLGITPDQVLFFDFPDGNIPQRAVEETIRFFATLYPGSVHCTVNIKDTHKDHQTLARALAKVATDDNLEIYPKYFHVYAYQDPAQLDMMLGKPILYPEVRQQALAEFTKWDPPNHRYAVGSSSTPRLFEAVSSSDYEYFDLGYKGTPPGKIMFSAGARFSNLGIEGLATIGDKFSFNGFYEFNSSSFLVGAGINFKNIMPSVDLNWSIGYHLAEQRLFTMITTTVASHLVVQALHTYGSKTTFGVGLATSWF